MASQSFPQAIIEELIESSRCCSRHRRLSSRTQTGASSPAAPRDHGIGKARLLVTASAPLGGPGAVVPAQRAHLQAPAANGPDRVTQQATVQISAGDGSGNVARQRHLQAPIADGPHRIAGDDDDLAGRRRFLRRFAKVRTRTRRR